METSDSSLSSESGRSKAIKVLVLTTVMFTFISYWRAAAIVIGDLGSTMYYIGGIAEQFIGKVAPYFILLLMLFAYAVYALYIESSALFTRGGVYRVVKSALGGWFAKISVSALVFDYILTGPISSVSAGQYFAGLLNDVFKMAGIEIVLDRNIVSVIVAIAIILYFYWENVKGIEESSDKALKIFIVTAIMGVIILGLGIYTLYSKPEPVLTHFPPFKLELPDEAFGWLKNVDWIRSIGLISVLIAFGHTLLALSGAETLGQVYREIEYPKLKNLHKTVFVIFIFTVIMTPAVSFLSIMLIPDNIRPQYIDNLIGGIAMFLNVPIAVKIVVHIFVVLVGVLILSAACNTAIVGANSVLNRIAEDKVLTDWFRKPHKKYGTSFRILTLIAILQIIVIIASRGDVLILGEAYAFGVIWSLTLKGISLIVLRFKDKRPREWKVPVNIDIKGFHLPVGLIVISLLLFTAAVINLFTKPIATVSGAIFTVIFFLTFVISEQIVKRKTIEENHISDEEYERIHREQILEHFNLDDETQITPEAIESTNPNRILVAVKDPNNLSHLKKTIEEINTEDTDIIVMVARVFKDKQNIEVKPDIEEEERVLFTEVVNISEKIGKPVIPIVVPTNNAFYSIMNVAYSLKVKEIIIGLSAKFKPDIQMQQLALMWGAINPDESKKVKLRIIADNKEYSIEL
jgi:amino acid transporter